MVFFLYCPVFVLFSAFAAKSKKKKVRISPDVETQIQKKGKLSRSESPKIETSDQEKNFDIDAFMKGVEYFPPMVSFLFISQRVLFYLTVKC